MAADGLIREERPIVSLGEWLNWRMGLLTASRIGALFGVHPHLTLDELIAEMRGERRGSGDNSAMRRGRILEPAVIAALQEEHPEWNVTKATTFHVLPDQRLGCTPDAFGDDGLLIQCKTVAPSQWDQWHGHPPLHYLLQTLVELLTTNRRRGVLAIMVCNPSFPLHLFDVPRHPAAEQRILSACAEFWRKWDAGKHPMTQPADDLVADLDDGSHVDLSRDNELPAILTERASLKATTSTAEKRIKELDYAIKNRMGRATTAWLPGWNLSFRSQQRKETVIPAGTIRVLRVKSVTEEDTA